VAAESKAFVYSSFIVGVRVSNSANNTFVRLSFGIYFIVRGL